MKIHAPLPILALATLTALAAGCDEPLPEAPAGGVVAVTIEPGDWPDTLLVGDSAALDVEVIDDQGSLVLGAPVTWDAGDAASRIELRADSGDSRARALGLLPGRAVVTARVDGESFSNAAYEDSLLVLLDGVAFLTGSSDLASLSWAGDSVVIQARGLGTGGGAVAGTGLSWRRAGASLDTLHIYPGGDSALARAARDGADTVFVAHDGCVGQCEDTLVVTTERVATAVRVTPDDVTLADGDSVDLDAERVDEGGTPVAGGSFSWSSSDDAVATVAATGVVKAVGAGTATITATDGSLSGTASVAVRVVASVAVSPSTLDFTAVGDTSRLTATVLDQNDVEMTEVQVTWTSTATDVATVDSDGLVTAQGNGQAQVIASAGGKADTATVDVAQTATMVAVSPESDTLNAIGDTIQLSADATDAGGTPIAGSDLNWTSLDPTLASVDDQGRVVSLDVGDARIQASSGSLADTATIHVRQVLADIDILGLDTMLVDIGDTLTAVPRDSNGVAIDAGSFTFGWSSSDASVATVGNDGRLYAHEPGLTTVTVGANGVDGTRDFVLIALDFVQVSAGGKFACGLTAAGDAYCWGTDGGEQLGTSAQEDSPFPVRVEGDHTWSEIAAGAQHACGITTTGDAYCWGANQKGQLGTGSPTGTSCSFQACVATPAPVTGGMSWTAITAGSDFTCALATGGTPYCWGYNYDGQLGATTSDVCYDDAPCSAEPIAVSGGMTFDAIDSGGRHSCALDGGAAHCWGYNQTGQLGDSTTTSSTAPVAVIGGHTFQTITAGGGTSCGIDTGGAAYCWGYDDFGQLGVGGVGTGCRSGTIYHCTVEPLAVSGGLTFSEIDIGYWHTCALAAADGAAYCWGHNEWFDVGVAHTGETCGTFTIRECVSTPIAVAGGLVYTGISVGEYFSMAVADDGAYGWGYNYYDQLATNSPSDSDTAVQVRGTR